MKQSNIVFRTRRILTALAILVTIGISATGCMDGFEHPEQYPADGNANRPTATSNPQHVTASEFGHTWPMTVDQGTISCTYDDQGDPVMRFTAPDGTQYAINQVADNKELPVLSQLQSSDDKSLGAITSYSFTVCDVR